jgi:phosphatidate cytidylyltransferase
MEATSGGLMMSAIKRDRGVKDWGQMIGGHGRNARPAPIRRLRHAPIFFHITRTLLVDEL